MIHPGADSCWASYTLAPFFLFFLPNQQQKIKTQQRIVNSSTVDQTKKHDVLFRQKFTVSTVTWIVPKLVQHGSPIVLFFIDIHSRTKQVQFCVYWNLGWVETRRGSYTRHRQWYNRELVSIQWMEEREREKKTRFPFSNSRVCGWLAGISRCVRGGWKTRTNNREVFL